MPEPEALDINEDIFWRGLNGLITRLPRVLGEDLERLAGITETECSVIARLFDAPEKRLSLTEIAERTTLSPSRITRVVDAMSVRGLVTKEPNPDDRRKLFARITPAGRRAYERAQPEVLRLVRRTLFDHMTSEEVLAVGAVMCRLVEANDSPRPSGGRALSNPRTRTSAKVANHVTET